MPLSTAVQLKSTIQKLMAERREHKEAIAEIDEVFGQFGIKSELTRGRKRGSKNKKPTLMKVVKKAVDKRSDRGSGRPKKRTTTKPGPKKAVKAVVKSKPKSGLDAPGFVLGLIRRQGRLGAMRSDLSKAWGADGRRGAVHVVLHNLIRSKRVKATKLKSGDMVFRIA